MSWYVIDRPRPARPPVRYLVFAAILLPMLLVSGYPRFLAVPVTIDGEARRVGWSTTAGEVASRHLVGRTTGDLLSAKDRSVLVRGGGTSPRVFIEGRPAAPDVRIRSGMRITSIDGTDVVESIVTSEQVLPAPVVTSGRGPIVRVARKGVDGLKRSEVGSVSGAVISEKIVRRPTAMVVQRVWPSSKGKVVALTFDDGPWPGQTERVLDILSAEKVPATFFLVGVHVYEYPALTREIARRGHLLGNHTETHRVLTTAPWEASRREILDAEEAIETATGRRTHWFRPPGGGVSPTVYDAVDKLGMRMALWNVDPQDWRRPFTSVLVQRVLSAVKPGSVVLLHDGGGDRTRTIEALPVIIHALKKEGYTFVTLDDLPEATPVPVEIGR